MPALTARRWFAIISSLRISGTKGPVQHPVEPVGRTGASWQHCPACVVYRQPRESAHLEPNLNQPLPTTGPYDQTIPIQFRFHTGIMSGSVPAAPSAPINRCRPKLIHKYSHGLTFQSTWTWATQPGGHRIVASFRLLRRNYGRHDEPIQLERAITATSVAPANIAGSRPWWTSFRLGKGAASWATPMEC